MKTITILSALWASCLLFGTGAHAQPLCNVTLSGNTTITSGNSTTLTASYSPLGAGVVTYYWYPGSTSGQSISSLVVNPLTTTTYVVWACDSSTFCCDSTSITVYVQPCAFSVAISSTNVSCIGNDGSITATVTGGTPPYAYTWNNGQSTSAITGLNAGAYSVFVTDANNNCTVYAQDSIYQPYIVATTNSTPASCNGSNGTASAFATGTGAGPYTYLWSPGGQATQTATGLSAGNYTVTVADANGCTTTAISTVTQSTFQVYVDSSLTPTSCNGNNGAASVYLYGGTSPYTYLWSNGQTTTSATGLSVGSYSVIVTDANGCTGTASFTMTQFSFQSWIMTTPTSCNGNNGTAFDSTFGGTAPYTYAWSNGQTDQLITGLSVGSYSVIVTDANGCTSTAVCTITQSNGPTVFVQTNGTAGTATATASGGTAPYTYAWNTNPPQNGQTATGLVPGTYIITVTDANGCTTAHTFVLAQSACSNYDFESGDFSNYTGESGDNYNNNGTNPNVITWNGGLEQGPNDAPASSIYQHTILTVNMLDPYTIDPITGQPDVFMTTLAPNGGNFSVRLGNSINGYNGGCNFGCTAGLKIPYPVTASNTIFTYQFAGVYEDPAHMLTSQPGFMVNVYNQSGQKITSLSQTVYARDPLFASNPFIVSPNMGPNGAVIVYRRWQGLSIDLSAYVNTTVTFEFANFDCALGGHFGYTYLDGSCFGSLIGNVWPGDCDYDLHANNVDLLSIGLAYNATGSTRAGASTNWTAQPSADWAQSFTLGANYKHSDCNGDGVVNSNDMAAIALNYGNSHPFRMQQPVYNSALPDMYLVATADSAGPNTMVDVDIMLGKNSMPVDSIYAIAFSITYDPTYCFNALNMGSDFSSSWLGTNGSNMITLEKNLFSSGQIDLGLTRINHSDVLGGNGKIGTFSFRTTPVTSIGPGNISLMITGVKAITASGRVVSLNTIGDNVFFDPNLLGISEYHLNADLVSVFPNPASKDISVMLPSGLGNVSVEVINVMGQRMMTVTDVEQTTKLDVSSLPAGMYQMKISCDQGVVMKKIQVIKK